jgi:hypothetical protein
VRGSGDAIGRDVYRRCTFAACVGPSSRCNICKHSFGVLDGLCQARAKGAMFGYPRMSIVPLRERLSVEQTGTLHSLRGLALRSWCVDEVWSLVSPALQPCVARISLTTALDESLSHVWPRKQPAREHNVEHTWRGRSERRPSLESVRWWVSRHALRCLDCYELRMLSNAFLHTSMLVEVCAALEKEDVSGE